MLVDMGTARSKIRWLRSAQGVTTTATAITPVPTIISTRRGATPLSNQASATAGTVSST